MRYPIDLAEMMTALRREFLTRHFWSTAVEAKRQRGEIKEKWRGTIVSYSADLRPEEHREIAARVEAALRSGEDIKITADDVGLERVRSRLDQAVNALRHGERLLGPVLPLHADVAAAALRGEVVPFEQVKEHCRQVLVLALRGYRRTVETNFPGLAACFPFYKRGPVRGILALDPGFATGGGRSFLAFCESRAGVDEVIVHDLCEAKLDLSTDTVTTPEGTRPYACASFPDIGCFLKGPYTGRLEYDCGTAVLRRFVYGWIQRDSSAVKKVLNETEPLAQP